MRPGNRRVREVRFGWRQVALGVSVVALAACSDGDEETPVDGSGGSGGSGGSVSGAPSCDGLPDSCGPGADEDCCTAPEVSGGSYLRSYDGIDNTDDSNPATVSTFALDRFEVTVGRFRAFLVAGHGTQASPPAAGDGAHPLIADSGWDEAWNGSLAVDAAALTSAVQECDESAPRQGVTWTDAAGDHESKPMNCVNWWEAFAFCAWDGGRLPTEAEWNYAAAGGDEQRYYPWSAAYPPGSTVIDETYAVYGALGDGVPGLQDGNYISDILTVGSRSPKGDGRWGQADLAGNMWEWVLDWGGPTYPNPCDDCANLTAGASSRYGRGALYYNDPENLNTSRRLAAPMDYRNSGVGLRCARLP